MVMTRDFGNVHFVRLGSLIVPNDDKGHLHSAGLWTLVVGHFAERSLETPQKANPEVFKQYQPASEN